jgi:uncharacterized protein (TIGR00369 family)
MQIVPAFILVCYADSWLS